MNGHDGREASDGDICAITALPDQTERALQELEHQPQVHRVSEVQVHRVSERALQELDELAADARAYEYRTPKNLKDTSQTCLRSYRHP